MLIEALKYLTTPCPRIPREMGYLKEIIGMEARYARCRQAWRPHLDESRRLIIEAAQQCPSHKSAVILGSGLLLDVPIRELSDLFSEVILVDVVHLPVVRKKIRNLRNVRTLDHDISGVLEPLYKQVHEATPMNLPEGADIPYGNADLVVSCNVLTQLPIIPAQFLARGGKHSRAGIAVLSKTMIECHLKALSQLPGTVCLITEVEHQVVDQGEVVEYLDPLSGSAIPGVLMQAQRRWHWEFAPKPERHDQYDIRYLVEGYVKAA